MHEGSMVDLLRLLTSGPVNHPNIIDMSSHPHSHPIDKIPQTSNQDQWLHRSISYICSCFPSPISLVVTIQKKLATNDWK